MLSVAAAWWLFADLAAVWGPSLITIFGQAASTPPELMGAFALGSVLASFVVVLSLRWQPLLPLLLAVGARVVLAFQPGDQWQLWASSIGVAAALAWLAAVATRTGAALATGMAAGWTLQAVAAGVAGTWLAVWRFDVLAVLVLVVQVALLGVTSGVLGSRGMVPGAGPVTTRQAWSLLPVALVAGVTLSPGRMSAVDPSVGPFLLVLGCLVAVALTQRRWSRPWRAGWGTVAVAAVAASLYGTSVVAGVPGTLDPWLLVVPLVAPTAFAILLQDETATGTGAETTTGADSGTAARAATRPAPGSAPGPSAASGVPAVLGGAVVWVLLFFAYYAGYDLGYRADLLLVLTTAGLAASALRRRGTAIALGRTATQALVALAVLALVLAPDPAPDTGPLTDATLGEEWTVATYNVRMGYGTDGRFDPEAVADVVGDADVVLLQEVDRGWLLNGGQDQLAILARLTGKHFVFGPAADPVWGDAVLTSLPILETRGGALPSYGAVTGAGWVAARVRTGSEESIWVVSTHVQPTSTREDGTIDQARDLARVGADLAADGTPVVLGGDFNLEPGSPSFAELTGSTGFRDALAEQRPLPTSDSVDPVKEIDHVFVSDQITPVDARTVPTTASDHLPVLVTLRQ